MNLLPLRSDPPSQDMLQELLAAHYRGMVTDGVLAGLVAELGTYPAVDVLDAARRHVRDTRSARPGEAPAGHYAPTVADLLAQLQAIAVDRRRQEQEQRNREYGTPLEAERTGAATLRRLGWASLCKGAMAQRDAIVRHLCSTLALDLDDWDDRQVINDTYGAYVDSCWHPHSAGGWQAAPEHERLTMDQLVQHARHLLAERDGAIMAQEAAA